MSCIRLPSLRQTVDMKEVRNNMFSEKLNNGMRVVGETMPGYRSVSMGVWINAGSVYEQGDEIGAAHFIEHMLFKGEQINGTLEYFSQKLERTGFSFLIPEPSGATFYGKFAGYQDCYVLVETNNNIVYRVSVAFPRRHVWDDVSADFEYLKEMLIKKYGTPADSLIDFRTHEPRDNYSKLMKVKNNLCDYYIKFEMPRGTITLSIGSMEPSPVRRYNPCVVLAYEDKLNAQKEVTKAYDDL